jgi:hypothetical protein
LTGCATGSSLVWHSFDFDARLESPDIEILAYRYGSAKEHGTNSEDYRTSSGGSLQSESTNGEMLPGEFLYVKWRIKKNGQVYEDTIDLKSRLPANITNNKIHFIVSGPQLYVYLIGPEDQKMQPNPCPPRAGRPTLNQLTKPDDKIFTQYCDLKITRLYPN